jgi:alpha-tubulin suppressor-like RCC1 family protein
MSAASGRGPDELALEQALSALADEYDVERELGRGGTAVVYAARDRALARPVAIKLVVPAGEPERLEGLAREARTAAQLVHPNIVAVHAVKTLPGGALALVMQYVPGSSLREILQSEGAFPVERAAAILADVANALHHAHLRGTVHGDVKPENVLVDETSGRALLSDFGAAVGGDPLDSSPGMLAGTPAYMAPEQIEGGRVDARSDVFSLGVVGWELLTGLSPWGSGTPRQILARRIESLPPAVRDLRADAPAWLADAIDRALKAAPEDRWQSAEAMAEALETQRRGARFGAWRRGRKPGPRATPSNAAVAAAAPAASMDTVRWERPVPPLPPPAEELLEPLVTEPGPRRGRRLLLSALGVVLIGAAGALALVRQDELFSSFQPEVERQEVADRAPVEEVPFVAPPPSSMVPMPDSTIAGLEATVPGGSDTPVESAPLAATGETAASPVLQPSPRSEPVVSPEQFARAPERQAQQPPPETLPAAPQLSGVVGASSSTVRQVAPSSVTTVPPAAARDTPATPGRIAGDVVTRQADATLGTPSRTTFSAAARTVAGGQHSCLLDRNGAAWCWGTNTLGQLGSNGERASEPQRVGGTQRFNSLAAGRAHTCGLTDGSEAWCWGANDRGQIGDGSRVTRRSPSRISLRSRGVSIGVGANHACALDAGGAAWCWGANDRGQTGSGSIGSDVLTPRRVAGGHRFRSLSVGWDHACALDAEGRAWCWGSNDDGRLGDGSDSDQASPVLVAGDLRFTAISAGGAHSCGATADGAGYCWGRNASGQLGDGTVATARTPVRVSSSTPLANVTTGSAHSCALTRAGSIRCWGRNAYGQLGDGSTADRASPVPVVGDRRYTQVHASGGHTCATSTDGAAYCWGYNVQGQLGDGTRANRARPVLVGGAGGA